MVVVYCMLVLVYLEAGGDPVEHVHGGSLGIYFLVESV